jgi:hypothetical protein
MGRKLDSSAIMLKVKSTEFLTGGEGQAASGRATVEGAVDSKRDAARLAEDWFESCNSCTGFWVI